MSRNEISSRAHGCLLRHAVPFRAEGGAADRVPQRLVAITIDDLPEATLTTSGTIGEVMAARRSLQHIIEALQEHKAPAIGFVNEEKLQADDQLDIRVGLLEMWLDEGFTLGNHTYSHADFSDHACP